MGTRAGLEGAEEPVARAHVQSPFFFSFLLLAFTFQDVTCKILFFKNLVTSIHLLKRTKPQRVLSSGPSEGLFPPPPSSLTAPSPHCSEDNADTEAPAARLPRSQAACRFAVRGHLVLNRAAGLAVTSVGATCNLPTSPGSLISVFLGEK